ncbi:hypothetical protein [Mycoplasma todarodis]|uniref:hypothetical protein n=1 Tax=Mycoplasma todarodis TaxID=1937191 RepID=UPI003B2BD51C
MKKILIIGNGIHQNGITKNQYTTRKILTRLQNSEETFYLLDNNEIKTFLFELVLYREKWMNAIWYKANKNDFTQRIMWSGVFNEIYQIHRMKLKEILNDIELLYKLFGFWDFYKNKIPLGPMFDEEAYAKNNGLINRRKRIIQMSFANAIANELKINKNLKNLNLNFLSNFDIVATTNYDASLEQNSNAEIYHMHGSFNELSFDLDPRFDINQITIPNAPTYDNIYTPFLKEELLKIENEKPYLLGNYILAQTTFPKESLACLNNAFTKTRPSEMFEQYKDADITFFGISLKNESFLRMGVAKRITYIYATKEDEEYFIRWIKRLKNPYIDSVTKPLEKFLEETNMFKI